MIVREERPADVRPIFDIVASAFTGHPHSDGSEPYIVSALRDAGALTLSLVAEDDGTIVGHIAFSPIEIDDASPDCYGLGPVAVLPTQQGKGIGALLIEEGLARLRAMNARACVLLGDPAYYRRFGFAHDPDLRYPGPPPEYFQRFVLSGAAPSGEVRYHSAFDQKAP